MATVDNLEDLQGQARLINEHALKNEFVRYTLDLQVCVAIDLVDADELFDGRRWLSIPGPPYHPNRIGQVEVIMPVDGRFVA